MIELKIPAPQISEVFDSGKVVHLYNTRTTRGRWVAATDTMFQQWQHSTNTVILKLFEVGALPRAALSAAAAQGIHLPYWRDRLRALPGWVVCQATLEQFVPGQWRMIHSKVAYVQDPLASRTSAPAIFSYNHKMKRRYK